MANEIPLADKWIYSQLAADTQTTAIISTRIYRRQAPKGATFPCVVFSFLSGADVPGLGTVRLLAKPIFKITVVCEGSPTDAIVTVANRIDALFQTAVNSISESYVFSSRRTMPFEMTEPKDNGKEFYTHLGGLYRIAVHPVA